METELCGVQHNLVFFLSCVYTVHVFICATLVAYSMNYMSYSVTYLLLSNHISTVK